MTRRAEECNVCITTLARLDLPRAVSPGYCGGLYVIHGDALSAPPLVLIRDRKSGKLETAPYHCESWPPVCDCCAR